MMGRNAAPGERRPDLYRSGGRDPWATASDLVPNVGDRGKFEFGVYAIRGTGRAASRYVDLRNVGALIECCIFGTLIAEVRPEDVTLWARGYGDRQTTRDALSAVSFGSGFVHSRERRLLAGGQPFREGITWGWSADGRSVLLSPGEGEPVDGAPARRRRGDDGGLS